MTSSQTAGFRIGQGNPTRVSLTLAKSAARRHVGADNVLPAGGRAATLLAVCARCRSPSPKHGRVATMPIVLHVPVLRMDGAGGCTIRRPERALPAMRPDHHDPGGGQPLWPGESAAGPGRQCRHPDAPAVGRSLWAIAAGYFGLFAMLFFPAPFALVLGSSPFATSAGIRTDTGWAGPFSGW